MTLKVSIFAGTHGSSKDDPVLITRILKVAKGEKGTPGDRDPATRSFSSTPVVNPDPATDDLIVVVGQAEPLFFGNPGTAPRARKLTLCITDNGTSQTLDFGGQYRGIVAELPTSTVPNQVRYLGFLYNVADDKWDLLAVVPPL